MCASRQWLCNVSWACLFLYTSPQIWRYLTTSRQRVDADKVRQKWEERPVRAGWWFACETGLIATTLL